MPSTRSGGRSHLERDAKELVVVFQRIMPQNVTHAETVVTRPATLLPLTREIPRRGGTNEGRAGLATAPKREQTAPAKRSHTAGTAWPTAC